MSKKNQAEKMEKILWKEIFKLSCDVQGFQKGWDYIDDGIYTVYFFTIHD